MRFAGSLGWVVVLCLITCAALGQGRTNQVEELRQQLQQLRESFRKMQEQQQQQIESLQKQIDALQQPAIAVRTNSPPAQPLPLPTLPPPPSTPSGSRTAPVLPPPPLPSAAATAPSTPSPEPGAPWSPIAPITILGGQQNYLNLSFDGLIAAGTSTANDLDRLELGGHDPIERGFTVQNLETVFEGKVDPYFRGQANVVLQIDQHGETTVEAEEAYLETMALPANLQLRAGQFFTEFGRLNPTHPHTWDFVDLPLVMGRFLGPDGLRGAGARVSWLAPTPFYSELFLTVANSQGPTAFSFRYSHEDELFLGRPAEEGRVRTVEDMLFVPRYAAAFNLTDSQTIVAGTSAALGPNSSGQDSETQIYGVDLFWKWKSPRQNLGFPFATWQTEALIRRFEVGAYSGDVYLPPLPAETITDYGLYSQVAYGFKRGWVGALRGDYVFPDGTRGVRAD